MVEAGRRHAKYTYACTSSRRKTRYAKWQRINSCELMPWRRWMCCRRYWRRFKRETDAASQAGKDFRFSLGLCGYLLTPPEHLLTRRVLHTYWARTVMRN